MKHKVLIILTIILSFLAGVITHGALNKNICNNKIHYQRDLFLSQNKTMIDSFNVDLENYCITLSNNNIREELIICNYMKFLFSNFPVVEYNIIHHKNNKKIISTMVDSLHKFLPLVGKDYLYSQYTDMLWTLTKGQDNTLKLFNLYIIENLLINDYLSYVFKNSISLSYAKLINIPEKKNIKLGETYSSQLVFAVEDITGNKNILELVNDSIVNSLKVKEMVFKEIPKTTGKYHHDILFLFSGFYGDRGWSTSIDYEVK